MKQIRNFENEKKKVNQQIKNEIGDVRGLNKKMKGEIKRIKINVRRIRLKKEEIKKMEEYLKRKLKNNDIKVKESKRKND